jgi:DNA-binding CsgD family transcriptional regulator/tetratricopeptide (TPR) repeat protein
MSLACAGAHASMAVVVRIRSGAEFVGRESELSRLGELLAEVSVSGACAVLVGGDAGVGKTRLVTEFSARAARNRAVTAVGRCVDLGAGGLPYLPFVDVLTSFLGSADGTPAGPVATAVRQIERERPELMRLIGRAPDSPDSDCTLNRLALFDAVAKAFRAAARADGPSVILLEDLHWADASSRDLLRFLLSRLGDEPTLVVGTYRSDDLHRQHPLRPLLAELVRLPRVERLDVSCFDDDELRSFLTTLHGGELDERVVRDIGTRSQGNAFYAGELLVSASDDGSVPLPGGLADVLLARLEHLPEHVQRLAGIAAVAGRRVQDELLRQAFTATQTGGRTPGPVEGDPAGPTAHEALREAVAHHVLVPDGSGHFAFRHALLQEAVYYDLLPGERVRIHGLFAELLARHPDAATAVDLARHSAEANDLPRALDAWIRAAHEAARRLAPAETLSHYDQALRLWPSVPADRRPTGTGLAGLMIEAAQAASVSGAFRRAIALGRAAADEASRNGDVEGEARARQCLANHLTEDERCDDALTEIRRVYDLLDGFGPHPSRVWAATVEARLVCGGGHDRSSRRECMLRGRELVERALAEAHLLEMASAEVDLLVTLAKSDAFLRGAPAAAERLDEAVRRGAEAGGMGIKLLRVDFNLGHLALDVGDFVMARAHFERGLADAERAGLASCLNAIYSRLLLAQVMVKAGAWEDAIRTVTTERPRLPARESLFLIVPTLPVLAARDPAAVPARVAELESCDDRYPVLWHFVHGPLAEALTWLGRHEEAVEVVRKTFASFDGTGAPLTMGGLQMAALGITALADAWHAGAGIPASSQEGQDLLDRARRTASEGITRLPVLGPEGAAWLARAEAEVTRLTGPGDADAWREAHAAFGYGEVYGEAYTGWRLAQALLHTGGPCARDEAIELLDGVRRTAVELRAAPLRDAADATASLHRLPSTGRGTGVSVLTPREEQVLRLLAEGLTNREIGTCLHISEKTASVHVSNLLGKLGAGGRTEAVSVAYRRGLIGPLLRDTP